MSHKKIVLTLLFIFIFEIIFTCTLFLSSFINIFIRGGTGAVENDTASVDDYMDKEHIFTAQEKNLLIKYCFKDVNIFDMDGISVDETGKVYISCDYKDNKNLGHIFLIIKYDSTDDLINLKNKLNLQDVNSNSTNSKSLIFYSNSYPSITLDSYDIDSKIAYLSITKTLPSNYNVKSVSNSETVSDLENYFLRLNENNRLKKENETKTDVSASIKIFCIVNIIILIIVLFIIYISKHASK